MMIQLPVTLSPTAVTATVTMLRINGRLADEAELKELNRALQPPTKPREPR